MNRNEMLGLATSRREPWDVVVIGGGATGAGVAVDAASRDYSVLLLEQNDFGKGTSSRSTKLVHGGVRYLAQGNVSLVREALRERGLLRQNAPHLVRELAFVVPSYAWWASPFYGLGLAAYNLLSGSQKFGPTERLSRGAALARVPTLKRDRLRGGVLYYDGQFDDARLLIELVRTAAECAAVVLNYARVTGLTRDPGGRVNGVHVRDEEGGGEFHAAARVVVNATGVYCDGVRHMVEPAAERMVAPSRGAHVVLDRSFLPGDTAFVVPKTPDGRVMFAIPWHGHTLVGTTDVAISDAPLEPAPSRDEIDFILETAGRYLEKPPTRADVLSTFAGIRPLVKAGGRNTAALSRDHTIREDAGMLTITGGKWTTYRNMAEDCVNRAAELGGLIQRPCVTQSLPIHGAHDSAGQFGALAVYGSEAPRIAELARAEPGLAERLHPDLPYTAAEVVWAARNEMARTVEDVLARRLRALFLSARAAVAMAPRVAELLARELGRDPARQAAQVSAFRALAAGYAV